MYLICFAVVPLALALGQDVSILSMYQRVVLLLSLSAFGLLLGLFWLTRLLPFGLRAMKLSAMLRWHKVIGSVAGTVVLVHPILLIGRRFFVQESNPVDNLMLLLRAPLLRSGIIAWLLLLVIVLLGIFRRAVPAKGWRISHAALAAGFTIFATLHVVAVGRHSDGLMSIFWIVLAGGALMALFNQTILKKKKGGAHESAQ